MVDLRYYNSIGLLLFLFCNQVFVLFGLCFVGIRRVAILHPLIPQAHLPATHLPAIMKIKPLSIQSLYQVVAAMPEIRELKSVAVAAKNYLHNLQIQAFLQWSYTWVATTAFVVWVVDTVASWWSATDVLKYLWLGSHLLTVGGFLVYMKILPGGDSYTATLVACTMTYLLVTYRSLRIAYYNISKSIQRQSRPVEMISPSPSVVEISDVVFSENTQLVCVSLLLHLSPTNTFKLLSFYIYSMMNLLSYVMLEFCQIYSLSPGVQVLNYIEFPLLMAANYSEIFVIFIYLQECFTEGNISNFLLYCLLYQMRLMKSDISRLSLHSILIVVAKLVTASPSSHLGPILLRVLPISASANSPEPKVGASRKISVKKPRVASLIFDCFPVVNDIFD